MAEVIHVQSLEQPLHAFSTGARVWRPSASRFDLAYLRIGRVIRATDPQTGKHLVGVLYVGTDAVIEYGEDDVFAHPTLE